MAPRLSLMIREALGATSMVLFLGLWCNFGNILAFLHKVLFTIESCREHDFNSIFCLFVCFY